MRNNRNKHTIDWSKTLKKIPRQILSHINRRYLHNNLLPSENLVPWGRYKFSARAYLGANKAWRIYIITLLLAIVSLCSIALSAYVDNNLHRNLDNPSMFIAVVILITIFWSLNNLLWAFRKFNVPTETL